LLINNEAIAVTTAFCFLHYCLLAENWRTECCSRWQWAYCAA